MSEPTQVPRRFLVAIAVASGAVTIAVAITVGAFTGYIGRRPAPAIAEPTPEPPPVLVERATPAPETQEPQLVYTADPPRFTDDDHDRDHDRDDEDDDD